MNTPLNPRVDMKTRSKLLILNMIRHSGACSRIDLSARIGMTKSAVTLLTSEMMQEGVLYEQGENTEMQQKRGRRKVLLSIDPNCRLAFGAAIDEKTLTVGLSNLHGDSLEHIRTDIEGMHYRAVLSALFEQVQQMMRDNCIPAARVLGVGVVLGDRAAGLVEGGAGAEKLTRLKRDLAYAVKIPIITARTATGMLIAQRLFYGENARHAVLLRCGKAAPAEVGVLANGRPYSGVHGQLGAEFSDVGETPYRRVAELAALYAQLIDPEKIYLCGELFDEEEMLKMVSDRAVEIAGRPITILRASADEENLHLCGCAICVERCFYLDSAQAV